ncbi:MAG: Error-prone repair protein ImuA [Chitinophagaceae bacterium]
MDQLSTKKQAIEALKKELFFLQGFKATASKPELASSLGSILQAFPEKRFPLSAVHEFVALTNEDNNASRGFIAGLLSLIAGNNCALLWITTGPAIFPPALKRFGIDAQRILFIHLKNHKDRLWSLEQALQCNALPAVVAEISDLNFIESRRLQLAVEKSQSTCFLLRKSPKHLGVTAATARWHISTLPSYAVDGLPGLGHPHWHIELSKVKNGKTGAWQMQWKGNHFEESNTTKKTITELQRIA